VIKTVEASANFEKSTLNAVVEARAKATAINVDINDQASLDRFQQAQGQLQSSFGRLLAVAENYPDLKTTKGFPGFSNADRRNGEPDQCSPAGLQWRCE
jgi:LemA protein